MESRINYETSNKIKNVIHKIDRTEDIQFSPNNNRLAVLDFSDNKIYLFAIRIEQTSETPKITIFDCSIYSSASLNKPHGLAFLDNNHIVICNRNSNVDIFKLPPIEKGLNEYTIKPKYTINGKGFLFAKVKTPGSIISYKLTSDCYCIMVCNNHWHTVTSHTIKIDDSIQVKNEGVLIENALRIPDGISISHDHTWIAISNHLHGEVLVYQNRNGLNKYTTPKAILRGIVCPHGLQFSLDGKKVFVADAASQYLHVFECEHGRWNGQYNPYKSIRLLDDKSFYAANFDVGEGGIKGIAVNSSNTVLASTRKYDPICFYDLRNILSNPDNLNKDIFIELCNQRDSLLKTSKKSKKILGHQWNYKIRVKRAITSNKYLNTKLYRNRFSRFSTLIFLKYLKLRNIFSKENLLDVSGPVLSLTTHGKRLELVFYTIETIGIGNKKPSRIILWLDNKDVYLNPPKTLQHLKSRGLEIYHSENLGPHTKYYPYIDYESKFHIPLVTADDDILYPRHWLQQLIEAYEANPKSIHCHRAHRMSLNKNRFMPYNQWIPCSNTTPSHLNFITGTSGVIYPPIFLKFLKNKNRKFEYLCPKADDIWLTLNAFHGGFKVSQVNARSVHYKMTPGTQSQRLMQNNVVNGGNQFQLAQTFNKTDIKALYAHLSSEHNQSDYMKAI